MAQIIFLLLLLNDVRLDLLLLFPDGRNLLPQIFVLNKQFLLLTLRLHLLIQRNVLIPDRVVPLLLREHSILVYILQLIHGLVQIVLHLLLLAHGLLKARFHLD